MKAIEFIQNKYRDTVSNRAGQKSWGASTSNKNSWKPKLNFSPSKLIQRIENTVAGYFFENRPKSNPINTTPPPGFAGQRTLKGRQTELKNNIENGNGLNTSIKQGTQMSPPIARSEPTHGNLEGLGLKNRNSVDNSNQNPSLKSKLSKRFIPLVNNQLKKIQQIIKLEKTREVINKISKPFTTLVNNQFEKIREITKKREGIVTEPPQNDPDQDTPQNNETPLNTEAATTEGIYDLTNDETSYYSNQGNLNGAQDISSEFTYEDMNSPASSENQYDQPISINDNDIYAEADDSIPDSYGKNATPTGQNIILPDNRESAEDKYEALNKDDPYFVSPDENKNQSDYATASAARPPSPK